MAKIVEKRARFAPSPTGGFHVGGARTALFNYLLTKPKGSFILRIEDTDQKRYSSNSALEMMSGLKYLGLDWDEGPDEEDLKRLDIPEDKISEFTSGGSYGPYLQSRRSERYIQVAQQMVKTGMAYVCYGDEDLFQYRFNAERGRFGDPSHIADPSIRCHVRWFLPRNTRITAPDSIRGNINFNTSKLYDAVIIKSDGLPTYHLANVVDDHDMKITHVLRGSEWIPSLPMHFWAFQQLGWEPPEYTHLPLILSSNGRGKLSKRSMDETGQGVFVKDFEEKGYSPGALLAYLATLGWTPKEEPLSLEDMKDLFDITGISRTGARWDNKKLRHISKDYILKTMPQAQFVRELSNFISFHYPEYSKDKVMDICSKLYFHLRKRIFVYSDGLSWIKFALEEKMEYAPEMFLRGDLTLRKSLSYLEEGYTITRGVADYKANLLEEGFRASANRLKERAGIFFWPTRISTTGQLVAPPLFESMEMLGREETLRRIENGILFLERNVL